MCVPPSHHPPIPKAVDFLIKVPKSEDSSGTKRGTSSAFCSGAFSRSFGGLTSNTIHPSAINLENSEAGTLRTFPGVAANGAGPPWDGIEADLTRTLDELLLVLPETMFRDTTALVTFCLLVVASVRCTPDTETQQEIADMVILRLEWISIKTN
mmetsp:Transcript_12134/g.24402  ORF Transcript_12134/g.24402 Transcript_12134/m.24402 type:complete len:154 (-) Transcript_12134:61-522(-)